MSDAMAIGAIRAARALGLRVPADLSVAGFDDGDTSRHTDSSGVARVRRDGRRCERLRG